MKQAFFFVLVCFTCSCQRVQDKRKAETKEANTIEFFSREIQDSFKVFVSLPEDYDKSKHYPVLYLLDANYNFDVMQAIAHNHAMFGMLPPLIIAGIGYRNAWLMDSLRDRDFTYPAAPEGSSFEISGGGDKFFSFIKNDVIPHMDKHYATDPQKRILAGHSLAGFFTLYALQQYALGKDSSFHAYIAGSPSLEYNDDYLLKQFDSMPVVPHQQKPYLYLTFGGMEDAETEAEGEVARGMTLFNAFNRTLQSRHNPHILSQSDHYSAFTHMDTPFPTFTKGMQWVLNR